MCIQFVSYMGNTHLWLEGYIVKYALVGKMPVMLIWIGYDRFSHAMCTCIVLQDMWCSESGAYVNYSCSGIVDPKQS